MIPQSVCQPWPPDRQLTPAQSRRCYANPWDTIEAIPKGGDLHVVSVDGDYGSVLHSGTPNSFLAEEYASKKEGALHLYSGLQSFFTKHFGQIKLATDIAKVKAIENLAKSSNFYSTHLAVAALEPFKADLTSQDILKLVEIAETNNQVGWIIGDTGVHALYKSLAESMEVDQALKARLLALLPTEQTVAKEDDDLPF